MPWSGGTYTRSDGTYTGSTIWLSNKNAGIKIVTSHHDLHDQDLATGINSTLTKDGSNTPTANLPMGGFRHTGVGTAAATSQYARADQVANNSMQYAGTAVSASGTLYTISNPFSGTSLTIGQKFQFISTQASTASTYIAVTGAGSALLTPADGTSALATGGIVANELVDVAYSNLAGGIFQKLNAKATENFTNINVTGIGTVATMAGNPIFPGTAVINRITGTSEAITGSSSIGTLGVTSSAAVGGALTVTGSASVGTLGVTTTASVTGLATVGTLSPTQGIVAVSTSSNAAAGRIGEYTSVDVNSASPVALTTGTAANVGSLALTAGDWLVWFQPQFTGSTTTTITNFIASISTASATLDTTNGRYSLTPSLGDSTPFSEVVPVSLMCGPCRVSIGSTTNVYAVARSTFATSTCAVYGVMQAFRPR